MGHLRASVYAGVGPAGADQPGSLVDVQHPGQPELQLTLHGPLTGLGRPAGEGGAVVAQVQPPALPGRVSRHGGS